MPSLKDNLYYFRISTDNPEPIWDRAFYPFLEKLVSNSEFKNIQEMESYLSKLEVNVSNEEIKVLLQLISKKGCKKSYFAFFLRTCDLSVAELIGEDYYTENERVRALKNSVLEYLKNRKATFTDKNSLQAYNDAQTVKRRGNAGENKLISLSGLKLADNIDNLGGKINKVSKGKGEFNYRTIKEKLEISSNINKEGKVPDIIFCYKGDIFIAEAKHVSGRGGSQSGSMSELIRLVNLKDRNPKVHFIAFLDGSYMKYLSVSKSKKSGNKLERQRYRIEEALKKNTNNYFLNTKGFRVFINDLGIKH